MKVLINTKRLTLTRGLYDFVVYNQEHKHLGVCISYKVSLFKGIRDTIRAIRKDNILNGAKANINSRIGWNQYAKENNEKVFHKTIGRMPIDDDELHDFVEKGQVL